MDVLQNITKDQIREIPKFRVGDSIRVHYRIVEGGKERIQAYEGTVISMSNKGVSRTATVRRISYDVGVERIFPLNSPKIAKIEVTRKGFVRQAKLYYLRERVGKRANVKEAKRTKTTKAK